MSCSFFSDLVDLEVSSDSFGLFQKWRATQVGASGVQTAHLSPTSVVAGEGTEEKQERQTLPFLLWGPELQLGAWGAPPGHVPIPSSLAVP